MSVLAPRQALPLQLSPEAAFARHGKAMVSTSAFRAAVAALAERLPRIGEVAILCEDRYLFIQAFAATVLRGQTTLLSASHAPASVADLVAAYPACCVLDDSLTAFDRPTVFGANASPAADFIAAIGHTSGSTGRPVAHAKLWSELRATTALNAAAIHDALSSNCDARQPWIVATVPPQHMYGLETSVLLPLLAGFGVHSARPFLPTDVAATLGDTPLPRVLVSTPVHLRALVESGVDFPEVAVVVSATAPLEQDVARRVEERFGATLLEMFGSTETCVIATRRTAKQEHWRPYPGIGLKSSSGGTTVRAPWLARAEVLQDILELHEDGSFTIIGRHSDLVEVAGKRASLADLTQRLISVTGVEDAIVLQLAAESSRVRRCAAVVVAPGLSAREVLQRFRQKVDAAFLPRPLVVVAALPRNTIGKVPMESVLKLLERSFHD